MHASDIAALFERTLLGDYDADEPWAAVHALRLDGSREIFDHAAEWCASHDPLKRARAADVLCQLQRGPERMFRNESYPLITKMLEGERDSLVLLSAIHALGHLDNDKAVPLILSYQDHPDEDVRHAVACALGCFPNDPHSVGGLLKLTSDTDAGARDWAVFGLGVQGDVDSPEIREVLLRCLDDENEDVREEAAIGLGKRQDRRLLPKLFAMLDECDVKVRVAEAAAALLGLDPDPPAWRAADYKAALMNKFEIAG
jgi:HEAT repeat protein